LFLWVFYEPSLPLEKIFGAKGSLAFYYCVSCLILYTFVLPAGRLSGQIRIDLPGFRAEIVDPRVRDS
jgi:hypothetical protein